MGCDKNKGNCMLRGTLLNSDMFDVTTKTLIERDLGKYCDSTDPKVYKSCTGYRIQERFLNQKKR